MADTTKTVVKKQTGEPSRIKGKTVVKYGESIPDFPCETPVEKAAKSEQKFLNAMEKLHNLERRLSSKLGRLPTDEELEAETGLSRKSIQSWRDQEWLYTELDQYRICNDELRQAQALPDGAERETRLKDAIGILMQLADEGFSLAKYRLGMLCAKKNPERSRKYLEEARAGVRGLALLGVPEAKEAFLLFEVGAI